MVCLTNRAMNVRKTEVYLICQTKHLLAETAAPDSCLAKANKTFTLKRDSQTNHKGALNAGLQGRISSAAAAVGADMAIRNVRCSPQYARSAEEIQWFLSGHPTTSRFIARTASSRETTGINQQGPSLHGGGFFICKEYLTEAVLRARESGGVVWFSQCHYKRGSAPKLSQDAPK